MTALVNILRHGTPALTGTALIAGLGVSGVATARWLARHDRPFVLADGTRRPARLAELAECLGDIMDCRDSNDVDAALRNIGYVVASPGIALDSPLLLAAKERRLPVIGDIELFARAVALSGTPVIAITGSNGKSTVTTWVGEVLKAAGYNAGVGGNIGVPALDLLPAAGDPAADVYVLELSSFQLDTTTSLAPSVATVLNVSPDHMDRYESYDAYVESKASIFGDNPKTVAVINADDLSVADMSVPGKSLRFANERRTDVDYAIGKHLGQFWLLRRGGPVLPVDELHLPGRHNQLNALAVIALIDALPLAVDDELLKQQLRDFRGLAHRTEWVSDAHGLQWFNDSKATNVGATLAALAGMPGPLWLLAGGEGKDQDFAALRAGLSKRVKGVIVYGRDAALIAGVLANDVPVTRLLTLGEAVAWCFENASHGDQVLLSPACASFDQFGGYVDRGEQFVAAIEALEARS